MKGVYHTAVELTELNYMLKNLAEEQKGNTSSSSGKKRKPKDEKRSLISKRIAAERPKDGKGKFLPKVKGSDDTSGVIYIQCPDCGRKGQSTEVVALN